MQKIQSAVFIKILHQEFQLPSFIIDNKWTKNHYKLWLQKKAYKLVLRDKQRFPGYDNITIESYLAKIHKAVIESGGRDHYTSEHLDWGLLAKENNKASHKLKWKIKQEFGRLPLVVHDNPNNPYSAFRVCSYITHDYKNEKDIKHLLHFCDKVIRTIAMREEESLAAA